MGGPAKVVEILCIEDNEADRTLIRLMFHCKKLKCRLWFAEDGGAGLDFLYQRAPFAQCPRPDLILLDLNMPGVDGRKVLETIKSEPLLKHIPVIVLTSSSARCDIESTYSLHANCYIVKPNELDDFERVLEKIEEYWLHHATLSPGIPKQG